MGQQVLLLMELKTGTHFLENNLAIYSKSLKYDYI